MCLRASDVCCVCEWCACCGFDECVGVLCVCGGVCVHVVWYVCVRVVCV